MSTTYYVVLSFVEGEDGDLIAEEPREAQSKGQAEATARALKSQKAAVIAFSRTGNPDVGEFQPAVEIVRYGRVPDDLE
jgi:predicted Fe-Mo cluster-binding NifX family protein